MKISERTIITLDLTAEEQTALTMTRHLLDEFEAKLIKRNGIENADTGEAIDYDDLDIARNLLDVLLNNGHPTHWERHD